MRDQQVHVYFRFFNAGRFSPFEVAKKETRAVFSFITFVPSVP